MLCGFVKRAGIFEQQTLRLCNLQNTCQAFRNSPKLPFENTIPSHVQFHTTPNHNRLFYEEDKKGGYKTATEYMTNYEHFLDGFRDLKQEVKLWSNEMRERLNFYPVILYRPGETDVLWRFNDTESFENFVTSSDKDHKEGFSTCSLTLSEAGRGLFSGNLDSRAPKDGRVSKAGYCAMRTKRARKSFRRETTWDWSMYNTLVMKVRGDGRSYILNLSTEGCFDILWNDIFNHVLFTRGGPYWQTVKIPFSKFALGSKGKVQDKQGRIPLSRVTHFGIACGEGINGSFSLEIEYIGLEFNPEHDEYFAYELYRTDKNIAEH